MKKVSDLIASGLRLHGLNDLEGAEAIYRKVLRRHPNNFDALHLNGVLRLMLGDHQMAITMLKQALAVFDGFFAVHGNLGNALQAMGQHSAALESYNRAIELNPAAAEILANKATSNLALGQADAAIESCQRALSLAPNLCQAHLNLAVIYYEKRKFKCALDCYSATLRIDPRQPDAVAGYATCLVDLERCDEALPAFDALVLAAPDNADAHYNLGRCHYRMQAYPQAEASYRRAIALRPGEVRYHQNLGAALHRLQRFDDAAASYHQAITIAPTDTDSYVNLGKLLLDRGHSVEALALFDHVVAIDPGCFEGHLGRASAAEQLGQLDDALLYNAMARSVAPNDSRLTGATLSLKMKMCLWDDFDNELGTLLACIGQGKNHIAPWTPLSLTADRTMHRRAAQSFIDGELPPSVSPVGPPVPREDGRISIGYFSPDFHDHAIAVLIAGLFEQHDRSRFRIVAYSFGPQSDGALRKRIEIAFDTFTDVSGMSDDQIARLAISDGIDIAVDLAGFTRNSRPGIFLNRAAPLQVNYLGFPGTLASPQIDYIIADDIVIPEEHCDSYSERIVWLPGSYQVNDSKRPIANTRPMRSALGLPDAAFVFCCFNSSHKILPATFRSWMRIMQRVPHSILWLFESNEPATRNLRREAEAAGIDPQRLVFAQPLKLADHLARVQLADLFLDTLPYNAHTTASDALWAGVPVLTQMGDAFAGRVAASLLRAVGLEDLITLSQDAYESLAVDLALDRDRLRRLRERLADNRPKAPLFDTALFARRIECAYSAMHARRRDGLAPDHIRVPV